MYPGCLWLPPSCTTQTLASWRSWTGQASRSGNVTIGENNRQNPPPPSSTKRLFCSSSNKYARFGEARVSLKSRMCVLLHTCVCVCVHAQMCVHAYAFVYMCASVCVCGERERDRESWSQLKILLLNYAFKQTFSIAARHNVHCCYIQHWK